MFEAGGVAGGDEGAGIRQGKGGTRVIELYGPKSMRRARLLLLCTIAGASGMPALAQRPARAPARTPARAPAAAASAAVAATPAGETIKSIVVTGAQRLEADTVRSYVKLQPGGVYTRELGDQALKDLYATELFADVQVKDDGQGNLTIQVRENPVINRIVLEGNKRLKSDKINPEIRLAPRQIFTRSKVRADVARIVELYRRQGRFAASVEPKMVMLDQNRVDVIFEISEGAKSRVQRINIIGNEKFSDGELRGQMATKESGLTKIFSSGTSYDPDRLSYDQQKLRQFYLTNGYADFRVVSAVAELTPDKRDFIITYVVEEGPRYKFGEVDLESDIRDIKAADFKSLLLMKQGEWYNAKQIEDTVDRLTEATGLLGYTPDVSPDFQRDKEALTMSVTFQIKDAPRRYVERIDINGNTVTRDKVVRREFRLSEGDAFNSFRVKRSRDRIQSLGFFQDKLEIEQKPGSAPDRVVLEANLEEKSTGELQVSAGFSSLERFIVDLSIQQRNFMGKGQIVRASVNYSTYSKSVEVGFTEPYLFDKNIAVGGDIFRRDFNSFNFLSNGDRNTTYQQITTGFQLRAGVPLTEYVSLALRYGLSLDDVTLDRDTYFFNGQCDVLLAGRYLCDAIGNRTTSSVGASLVFDNLNNRVRPSAGQRAVLSVDGAGLGGTVKYVRARLEGAKYWGLGSGFIFSVSGEGGYIHSLEGTRTNDAGESIEKIRLTDRFFLGQPQMRGFGIRGIGPRVVRQFYDTTTTDPDDFLDESNDQDDALGGRAYYIGHAELEIPLGSGARELGLRPSIFVDAGAVFGLKAPRVQDYPPGSAALTRDILGASGQTQCIATDGTTITDRPTAGCESVGLSNYSQTISAPFKETYLGDTPKPRLSVGFGVNWNSPFGPFRIDIAKALLKERGDNTKLFTFNVGTQF